MIKILIVDDSALVRTLLREILSRQPDMEVVGAASNPLVAREMIKQLNPDVLTLDIEMPHMDGIDFLGRLMRLRPMPVVMFSTLTERGSEMTLRALELGAVDFVAKPKVGLADTIHDYADEIVEKVRIAAKARLRRQSLPALISEKYSADVILPPLKVSTAATERIIVIGASTGGTEAIREVLVRLPENCPAVLIAQHMPEAFTRPFAERLNRLSRINVAEAESGLLLRPGHAYIAPGHSHLLLVRRGGRYFTELNDGPPVNRHRPSVDVLFRSAANCAGKNATGVLLTGMGKDGAAGLLEMKEAGARTLVQDESTCVVFGMPHEAIELGAADEVLPLPRMAERILASVTGR